MLDSTIKKFTSTAALMLVELLGKSQPEIEVYEDMAVLNYALPEPMDMDDVLDILEDRADMQTFYIAEKPKANGHVAYHGCSVCIPAGWYMYKAFVQCEKGQKVTHIKFSLFCSLEQLHLSSLDDQMLHQSKNYHFEYLMDNGKYAALFCL